MPFIEQFEVMAVDLPFRLSFKHAAAERRVSSSVFCDAKRIPVWSGSAKACPDLTLRVRPKQRLWRCCAIRCCRIWLASRSTGWTTFSLSCSHVTAKRPRHGLPQRSPKALRGRPVDLALLDTFGKAFGTAVRLNEQTALPPKLRYSGVQSSGSGFGFVLTLLAYRLFGIRQLKLKVEGEEFIQKRSRCGISWANGLTCEPMRIWPGRGSGHIRHEPTCRSGHSHV